jgi:hypothetical protein
MSADKSQTFAHADDAQASFFIKLAGIEASAVIHDREL